MKCVIHVVGLEALKKFVLIVKGASLLTIEVFAYYYYFLLDRRLKLAPLRGCKWRNMCY